MAERTAFFVGGGSIGHIGPAIAVARALQRQVPDCRIRFLCSSRAEDREFIERQGFLASPLPAPRLSFSFPWKFLQAYNAARDLLVQHEPSVIFSKGGYVSVPVCLAARRLGIPIMLHESDAVSGWANRLVARWADSICLGVDRETHNTPRYVVTGNPIDPGITQGSRDDGLGLTGLSGTRPILLVLGGSQGSLAVNEAVAANLDDLLAVCDIIHITGKSKKTIRRAHAGYWQIPFAFEEYPHLFALADLAVSRAGAGVIAELAANGIPAILVPLRGVAHDHQELNARAAEASGGCVVLEQGRLDEHLVPAVRKLLEPREQARMSHAIRSLSRPDAARQIAEMIGRYLA
ncbi:MAG: UDP-N-acetylglucosamine--N-acetylmuramyl-(pentapeptide) pyrophosphoryl-undecaprenol N-acetylglucosamine transferase [Candidatus Peribacteraceae bacterium]|nr:UDP-N-acetylglucosamine--N-acetylmuramyl-(pentapeptide) pyrophosphoryl-undecaprenol N-acetylglucosamine transferase [Candidatus Peribacteraceae bacterium]